jgi:opacity protein-like surface antigen
MTKRLALGAAFGLCALSAAIAQQTQQSPTPAQQPQPTPQQGTPPSPAQSSPGRSGYYQFPQPAAPATPQYPQYYPYPQTPPPPAPPPPPQYVAAKPVVTVSEPLVHWHIDGGWSDPAGRSSNYLQGGYSVGAGFSVAPVHGSPFDLRFDVNYDRNDATQQLIALNQNSGAYINRGREEIWSGTLDLEMHVPLGGHVDVYFFGGGGAYNMSLSFGEPFYALGGYYGGGYYCNPSQEFCGGGFGEVKAASYTLTKFGWNAGAGLQGPLGPGVKWFLEGRYNRVQESNIAVPLAFIPVTVGLRF